MVYNDIRLDLKNIKKYFEEELQAMNQLKSKYWIVVANASKLKIFASNCNVSKIDTDLFFIEELDHDQSRLKTHDLVDDKPGHYKTHESGGSAYQRTTDAKEVQKIHFAEQITALLKKAKDSDRYEQLIIIAPEHFYGILNKHFKHIIQDNIHAVIHNDYTALTTVELAEKIIKQVYTK